MTYSPARSSCAHLPDQPVAGLVEDAREAIEPTRSEIDSLLAQYRAGDDAAGYELAHRLRYLVYQHARNRAYGETCDLGWRDLGPRYEAMAKTVMNTRNPKTKKAFKADGEELLRLIWNALNRRSKHPPSHELPICLGPRVSLENADQERAERFSPPDDMRHWCTDADQIKAVELFKKGNSIPAIAEQMNSTPYLIRKLFRQLLDVAKND
jgi:hypothetical protein